VRGGPLSVAVSLFSPTLSAAFETWFSLALTSVPSRNRVEDAPLVLHTQFARATSVARAAGAPTRGNRHGSTSHGRRRHRRRRPGIRRRRCPAQA